MSKLHFYFADVLAYPGKKIFAKVNLKIDVGKY